MSGLDRPTLYSFLDRPSLYTVTAPRPATDGGALDGGFVRLTGPVGTTLDDGPEPRQDGGITRMEGKPPPTETNASLRYPQLDGGE